MAALQLHLTGVLEEQDALRQQRETTEKRLTRAARLTDALGEEGLRWQRTAEALQARPVLRRSCSTVCFVALQLRTLRTTSMATVEQVPGKVCLPRAVTPGPDPC